MYTWFSWENIWWNQPQRHHIYFQAVNDLVAFKKSKKWIHFLNLDFTCTDIKWLFMNIFHKFICTRSNFEQCSVLAICPWNPKQQRRSNKNSKFACCGICLQFTKYTIWPRNEVIFVVFLISEFFRKCPKWGQLSIKEEKPTKSTRT